MPSRTQQRRLAKAQMDEYKRLILERNASVLSPYGYDELATNKEWQDFLNVREEHRRVNCEGGQCYYENPWYKIKRRNAAILAQKNLDDFVWIIKTKKELQQHMCNDVISIVKQYADYRTL